MKTEIKIIKYLLKEIVYKKHSASLFEGLRSSDINWKKLNSIIIYNELGPFLYVLLKERHSLVPENIFKFLKESYYFSLFNYMILFDELLEILKESKKNNILIIPIKGFSFSEEYYRRFGFRPLVDIDLLIKDNDFDKSISFLEGLGYKKHLSGASEDYWRKKQCHIGFIKIIKDIPVIVELHWALDFKRYKNEIMPDLWRRLKKIFLEKDEFPVMSPEDTLISLALHQRRFGKVLNLKYICDAGIILEKEEIDWDYIMKTAKEDSIRTTLYFLFLQIQFVLDKDLSKHLKELKIPFWHRKLIGMTIRKHIYSPQNITHFPHIYILCHFLLYDAITYPITYILNIPQEQFARFYQLPFYTPKTKRLYKLRYLYIPYKLIKEPLSRYFLKPSTLKNSINRLSLKDKTK